MITQEIADRVTGLYIVGYEDNVANLKSLAGLEVFKNMTTLSVVAPNAQLEDVDLSAYTNLTTVTVSPSKGYKSIKLPAGIVNFTSVCSNAQSIGPVDLDLTAYTNLETVDVGGSKALVSLNCKGLAKLKLIRAVFASAKTINISGCDLLQGYVGAQAAEGANLPFEQRGATIIVGSQEQYDALRSSWYDYYGGSPYCEMKIEE